MSNVLNKAERTYKAAEDSSEKYRAYKEGSQKGEYLLPRADKHVEVAEHVARRACELVEVVRAGENRKLNV